MALRRAVAFHGETHESLLDTPMTLAKIVQRCVDVAAPHESVQTAAQRMDSRCVGSLVVVEDGKPVGIVTDRDLAVRVLARGLDPFRTTVAEVMSREVHSIRARSSPETALEAMGEFSCRRLVVLRPDGTLEGIVSLDDLLGELGERFQALSRVLERTGPRVLQEPAK